MRSLERHMRLRATQLRREIATVRARSSSPVRGEVSDAKDAADFDAQAVVADAEVERDLAELREVNLALQRIDDGTYGVCNDCANSIDPDRLRAQPAALRCLDCQAIAENGSRRLARGHAGHRA
jgi:DnaK suppressor protein